MRQITKADDSILTSYEIYMGIVNNVHAGINQNDSHKYTRTSAPERERRGRNHRPTLDFEMKN